MLQIRNIKKEYHTGNLVQKALDDVSLNFRDNEFVAILGPSGSGKTTLLNIIGGLDRYDSGDLIINGISTRKYSDRDWDSYRNHTIGFVFQSYNLIPHQTVLQNVELALTIGGISREERRARAEEALRKVGLGDQMHKTPTQMSGGQMQRVAIARALVTDPDILLADEPTGALDSETSIQVMDLIREIARDRLVIMVTHNPELAEQYATRIVNLKDGKIISDTDPFVLEEGETEHRNLGRASMSLLTALALSFNNLKTKLTRTLLVAFAGSIGIIGIALILSLSTGVNGYIDEIESDTLNEYPLQITETGFDLTSMMSGGMMGTDEDSEGAPESALPGTDTVYAADEETQDKAKDEGRVKEFRIMSSMFSMLDQNDLQSLKAYFESGETNIYDYCKAIEYRYGVEPVIYSLDGKKTRQVHPDQTSQAMGIGYTGTSSIFSQMSNYNVFHQLPENEKLYKEQYDLKAGKWPENYNECVIVTSRFGRISDLALYALRLKDNAELEERTEAFAKGESIDVDDDEEELSFEYEDLLGIDFRIVNPSDAYVYNEKQEVWVSKKDNKKFMRKLARKSEKLTVVGVVKPRKDVKITALQEDIYYMPSLLTHTVEAAKDSEIVRMQLANPKTNVITGKKFGKGSDGMEMGDMFQVDEEGLAEAFQFDDSAFKNMANMFSGMDLSKMDFSKIDPSDFASVMPNVSQKDIERVLRAATSGFSQKKTEKMFRKLLNGYMKEAAKDPTTDYSKLGEAFSAYLESEEGRAIITANLQEIIAANADAMITQADLTQVVAAVMAGYSDYAKEQGFDDPTDMSHIQDYLASDAAQAILSEQLSAIYGKLANLTITSEQANKIAGQLAQGYLAYAKASGAIPDPTKMVDSFQKYLNKKSTQKLLRRMVTSSINQKQLNKELTRVMGKYSGSISKAGAAIVGQVFKSISKELTKNLGGVGMDLGSAFSFDSDKFATALGLNMTEEDMMELLSAMMNTGAATYENNLKEFGYVDFRKPMEIDIYPKDFESKEQVKAILEAYNDRMKKEDEEKVIVYTDLVATLMSSVTDIIDAISYVLIAFVSISLVVSSIMIGVITYISVLERRKEIGILRAIGASKRNISEVFNAETFIIGALAGLFGVGISLLLLFPINAVIDHVTTANVVAALPPLAGLALIVLSIILTLIGGIIPSRAAAKSDPVTALRVE